MKAVEMTTPDKNQDAAAARPRARLSRAWLLRLLLLAFLLVALAPFAGAIRAAVARNLANRPYLLTAMRAADGVAVATDGLVATNGLQARALAYAALRADRPSEAVHWLLEGTSTADPGALTRFEVCRLFAGQARIAEAKEYCRGAVVTAPYWLEQGIAADESGRPDEAAAYFDLARTANPDLLSAWERLGRAYFHAERYRETVAVYEHLLTVQTRPLVDTFYQLGIAYLALDKLDEAREALERGLDVYPYQRELHLALADTARAANDLVAADEWYARFLQQEPNDAYVWAGRGEVAMQRGLPQQAIIYLEEATALEPTAVGYWLSLAAAAAAADDQPRAAAAYEQVLTLRPDDVGVLLAAANFFAQSGHAAQARVLYQQVLALEPGNSTAVAALATPVAGQTP